MYSIMIYVNGEWVEAKSGNGSKWLSLGLFNQFRGEYSVRLFRGRDIGKLVAAYYRPEDLPVLSRTYFPQSLKNIG